MTKHAFKGASSAKLSLGWFIVVCLLLTGFHLLCFKVLILKAPFSFKLSDAKLLIT